MSDTEREAIRVVAGLVMQHLPGCMDIDPADYGIDPPHKEYISVHLGFDAAALRFLGKVGAMDIDDRGGRLVLGTFRPEWLEANGFVVTMWICRCGAERTA